MEEVILVNEADEPMGTMEKMQAHKEGLLHRAFSVFIFNSKGKMLLQQRAWEKYHSGGLWSNACCSHPQPGEDTKHAAHRRLKEEMGFDTELRHAFSFVYKSVFDNGLTEHEYDHVFTGIYDAEILPVPEEVKNFRFLSIEEIESSLQAAPEQFTSWFQIAFPALKKHMDQN